MLLGRIAAVILTLVLAAVPSAAGAGLRTAGPRDNAAHDSADVRTEWWFVGATDPATGFSVAAALGARFPGMPAATVVFLYPPGGGAPVTIGAPRLVTTPPATDRADVDLGGDRLWSPAPGVVRVRVTMDPGLVFSGRSPGPVALDLTFRSRSPGFLAGPLLLPGGQDIWWTVAMPSARVTGTVRMGSRTLRLRGVPGYHDHNYGDFDLGDPAHGGWDWSQVHLPGGRSLVTGIVRPIDPRMRDGVAVLSDATGRLGVARAPDVSIERGDWSAVDGHVYPRRLTLVATLSGGWRVRMRYRSLRALPLRFSRDGDSALVENEARIAGELRRDGRVVSTWSGAPGFYEYESTPVTRERDAAPGSVTRAAHLTLRIAAALRAR